LETASGRSLKIIGKKYQQSLESDTMWLFPKEISENRKKICRKHWLIKAKLTANPSLLLCIVKEPTNNTIKKHLCQIFQA